MAKRPPDEGGELEILEIIPVGDTGPVDPAGDEDSVEIDLAEPEPAPAPPRPEPVLHRHRQAGRKEGIRQVLREILPALDALEQCVRQRPDRDQMEEAVRLALRSLWNVFRPHDLERIEGDGLPFDPRVHEAAETTPTDRVPPGTVLEVLRVGYLLAGDLVRPALVRVSVEPETADRDDEERG